VCITLPLYQHRKYFTVVTYGNSKAFSTLAYFTTKLITAVNVFITSGPAVLRPTRVAGRRVDLSTCWTHMAFICKILYLCRPFLNWETFKTGKEIRPLLTPNAGERITSMLALLLTLPGDTEMTLQRCYKMSHYVLIQVITGMWTWGDERLNRAPSSTRWHN
jgi:hypothetical protein